MKIVKILMTATVLVALTSCNSQGVTKKELKTEVDSASYALGLNMATQLKGNFDEMDKDLFIQGFNNGVDSTDILMDSKSLQLFLSTFFRKKQQEAQEKQFAGVKKAGEDFLAENKSKEGVQTTASGLQYIVMKEGSGEKPVAASKVKVHYHGTSIDGAVFDSSVDKGKPSEFFVNQVVKGWTEGLQLMSIGSKYKFFVPQELAYGANPRPNGPIKPFQALVFEVELLEILKK